MFGPPLHVTVKAYGCDAMDSTHPDLDERDMQTCLVERLEQRSQRRRRAASTGQSSRLVTGKTEWCKGDGCRETGISGAGEGLFVFAPKQEGWLIKRGSFGLKLWRRRWVTLAAGRLWYNAGPPSRKEEEASERAVACMKITSGTRVVDDPNDLSFTVLPGASPGLFEDETVNAPLGSDSPPRPQPQGWLFRAESGQEKEVWLEKLRRCIEIATWKSNLRFGRVLGEGGFSVVQEMLDMQTGESVAVKKITARRRHERDQGVAEADVLTTVTTQIQHPHLMHVSKVYVEGNQLWLMFPLCKGGDLFHRVVAQGRLSEPEAAAITFRLLSALHALHRHGIVHLDVKTENILLGEDGSVDDMKLADFGLSKVFRSARSPLEEWDCLNNLRHQMHYDERINGTLGYMAPEIIQHKRYGPAADVWACGVVLFVLIVGYAPFGPGASREVLERSLRGEFDKSPESWGRVSPGAKDLLRKMLTVDDSQRITTDQALDHTWIIHHVRARPTGSGATYTARSSSQAPLVVSPRPMVAQGGWSQLIREGWRADRAVGAARPPQAYANVDATPRGSTHTAQLRALLASGFSAMLHSRMLTKAQSFLSPRTSPTCSSSDQDHHDERLDDEILGQEQGSASTSPVRPPITTLTTQALKGQDLRVSSQLRHVLSASRRSVSSPTRGKHSSPPLVAFVK